MYVKLLIASNPIIWNYIHIIVLRLNLMNFVLTYGYRYYCIAASVCFIALYNYICSFRHIRKLSRYVCTFRKHFIVKNISLLKNFVDNNEIHEHLLDEKF